MDETTENIEPHADADEETATDQDAPTAEPLYVPADVWGQIQSAENRARRDFFGLE